MDFFIVILSSFVKNEMVIIHVIILSFKILINLKFIGFCSLEISKF